MNLNQLPIPLTLPLDQVNVILTALGNLPYSQVEQLVASIRGTALAALKAAEEAAKVPRAEGE